MALDVMCISREMDWSRPTLSVWYGLPRGDDAISVFKEEVTSMKASRQYEVIRRYRGLYAGYLVSVAPQPVPQKPGLLDRLREEIRKRHYRRRTKKTYVGWIRRFIPFYGKRHSAEMGEVEVSSYLSHLAVSGKVVPQGTIRL